MNCIYVQSTDSSKHKIYDTIQDLMKLPLVIILYVNSIKPTDLLLLLFYCHNFFNVWKMIRLPFFQISFIIFPHGIYVIYGKTLIERQNFYNKI